MNGRVGICPQCLEEFEGGILVCPNDGKKLVLTEPNTNARIGQCIDKKFTIVGHLGTGGMGSVYRAVQHSMEREVALKLLKRSLSDDRTIVRRFLQEAKGASKLNHPNVITLFDFGQTEDGELYIVMELLEGESLQELLQREKRLSTSRTVAIMSQVCDALQAAHDAGVIHRDLKPDNVHVISGAGQMGEFIKVLDFGIAKVAAAQHTSQLTQTGSVCGTPAYMSPEQAMGQEIDPRSDVYATGILLYEMLSGQPPFVAETPVALMMAQVRDLPLPLGKAQPGLNIRPELDALLLETLAKKPEDRPQSAAILKDRLTRILDGPATIRTIDTGPVSMDLSYMPTETHMALEKTSESEKLPDTKPPETQPVFSANTMDLIDATSKSRRLPWAIAAVLFIAIVAILAYQLGGKDEKKKMNATLAAPTTATQNKAPSKTKDLTQTPSAKTKSEYAEPNAGHARTVEKKSALDSDKLAKAPEHKKAVLSTHIHIGSVPKNCTLYNESGVKVAITPYLVARPAAGTEYIYVVKKQGYLPERVQISATCPETRIALLKKTPAKTKMKTPAKTKKKTPAKTKKKTPAKTKKKLNFAR